jgi:acetyl esterase
MEAEFTRLAAARRIMAAGRPDGTLAEDREAAERWIRRFAMGTLDDEVAVDVEHHDDAVVARPRGGAPTTRILYVHGGGMVYYSPSLFVPFLALLAARTGAVVEAVDYPKVPDRPVDACVDALVDRVVERCAPVPGERLVLAGDSVGGLLALYLATRVLPGAVGRLVLVYPVLDLHTERDSYRAFGTGHFLDATAMARFKGFLTPCFTARGFDPFALADEELAALPPCVVVTAGCDVLCDEGVAWAHALRTGGTDVDHRHFPDLPHDFCLYAGTVSCARDAAESIATWCTP